MTYYHPGEPQTLVLVRHFAPSSRCRPFDVQAKPDLIEKESYQYLHHR